jgi:hypothetical protein
MSLRRMQNVQTPSREATVAGETGRRRLANSARAAAGYSASRLNSESNCSDSSSTRCGTA